MDFNAIIAAADTSMEATRRFGIQGKIERYRSLYWKLYLEVLSQNSTTWTVMMDKERTCYQELKDKFMIDPATLSSQFDDPLSQSEDVCS